MGFGLEDKEQAPAQGRGGAVGGCTPPQSNPSRCPGPVPGPVKDAQTPVSSLLRRQEPSKRGGWCVAGI